MGKNLTAYIVVGIAVVILLGSGGYLLLKGRKGDGGKEPLMPKNTETKPVVSKPPTAPTASPSGRESVKQPATEATEVTVSGDEFSFDPAAITAREGERVKIVFKNVGQAPHNLIIEGLNIGTQTIAGGQTDSFEFTAPRTGAYVFFCSVPGHREAGMEGTLTVE